MDTGHPEGGHAAGLPRLGAEERCVCVQEGLESSSEGSWKEGKGVVLSETPQALFSGVTSSVPWKRKGERS